MPKEGACTTDRRGPRSLRRAEVGAWPWRAGGHSGTSGQWVDVVVEPEDIVWIVASFDRDKPSVVGPPDLVHLLPVLGGQVVYVAPVGHVGAECLERLFGPGDVLLGFPLVSPLRDDEQAIAGCSVRERGGGGVDPRDGAQVGHDGQAAHG